MLSENIQKMNRCGTEGLDILIVTTSCAKQTQGWQKHLDALRGKGLKQDALILCVFEDWPDGAGNGLGTLYAYRLAQRIALEEYGIDIFEKQLEGASTAIYHTAGQGKRLAPLTLSEHNNKSKVKLPGFWQPNQTEPFTILEAVIKQTSFFAHSLQGRLGVFWGDQIFIPYTSWKFTPEHHVEVLSIHHSFPSSEEWIKRGLSQYGIAGKDAGEKGTLIDKVEYDVLQELVEGKKIDPKFGISTSLGSFSLSSEILEAFLEEFKTEMDQKSGKFDTDPHFWMPMTLDLDTYTALMRQRGIDSGIAQQHHARMQTFLKEFKSERPIFTTRDLGQNSCWWDFGTVQAYFKNNLKLVQESEEGKLLREFYCINRAGDETGSIILNSSIKAGNIRHSIVVGVTADKLDIDHCILIQCKLHDVRAEDSLLYNVNHDLMLSLSSQTVRADVASLRQEAATPLYTQFSRDGKNDWSQVVAPNSISYAQLSSQL